MGITRRSILKSGLIGTAGFLTPFKASAKSRQVDCLVLGAGIAGLTAGDRLQKSGKNVLILEGSDRLGGRILTDRKKLGSHVELGAQYIHLPPTSGLPIWDDVNRLRLASRQVPRTFNGVIYHSEWGEPKSFIEAAIAAGLLDISTIFVKLDHYDGPDRTLWQWIKQYDTRLKRDLALLALGVMAGPQKSLSIHGIQSDLMSDMESETDEYAVTGGYDQLVTRMARGLDIRHNQFIEHVHYDRSGVRVTTSEGLVYEARTAIFTFSIGMLKSGRVKFTPELPAYKKNALNFIHAGHESKVSIRFKQKFWPDNISLITRCDSQRRTGRVFFDENFGLPGKPPILSTLQGGDDGAKLRGKSDHEVLQKLCQDLNDIYPVRGGIYSMVQRRPDGSPMMARKQWMDDPFSMGGTSYISIDPRGRYDVRQARVDLATSYQTQPLFWAGEATTVGTQPASVHGAHWTGVRAAQEVLNHLRVSK